MNSDREGSASPSSEVVTVHEQFGPGNGADLVIQSSDGVLFHIDRRNLDRCAEAFPGSNATGITSESNDIVHLTETAEVLEILFQFGYPARHPVLDDLDFEKLLAVADAAEKYHFYSAAPMCQIVLRHNIPKHPIEVFRHAIKHDYPDDLIDEVARVLRPVPLTSASDPRIHPSVAPAWMIYHEAWRLIFKDACQQEKPRILLLFDPDIDVPNFPRHEFDALEEIETTCLHPCEQCYFTISSWFMQLAEGELWLSDKERLNAPLPWYVSSALVLCPCPAPFEHELSMIGTKMNRKETLNEYIINHIRLECRSAIPNMENFSDIKKAFFS